LFLSSEFKLRDLSAIHYFLSIEVQPTAMGLMLCQHKYIIDILTRASMTFCKPVDTSISTFKVTTYCQIRCFMTLHGFATKKASGTRQ